MFRISVKFSLFEFLECKIPETNSFEMLHSNWDEKYYSPVSKKSRYFYHLSEKFLGSTRIVWLLILLVMRVCSNGRPPYKYLQFLCNRSILDNHEVQLSPIFLIWSMSKMDFLWWFTAALSFGILSWSHNFYLQTMMGWRRKVLSEREPLKVQVHRIVQKLWTPKIKHFTE